MTPKEMSTLLDRSGTKISKDKLQEALRKSTDASVPFVAVGNVIIVKIRVS